MAFFAFKKGAFTQAKFLPAQDLASAGIEEYMLRDLLVQQLDKLDMERRLMVISCEYTNWSDAGRRIDILGLDENQNLVVVELKRTKDGGHAELQALRYAAMLSTHTFGNVLDALLAHRRKTDKDATRDKAQADLLEFLGKANSLEVKLNPIPRIILVAQGFSTEITTTALWLMEHMNIEISCYTVTLYPYSDGSALHFDLLLPLPQQVDYFVKVRDKHNEEAAQLGTVQRRQRACQILEAHDQLKKNDLLHLVRLPKPQLLITDDAQRHATYLGDGRVLWAFDQKEYSSLTSLCSRLCEEHSQPLKYSTQGTAYWGKIGTSVSLSQAAQAYDQHIDPPLIS